MTDFKKLEELHKKLEKINSEHDPEMNFEHELLEHLKNKFPKEYKLTIEAKKKMNLMRIQKTLLLEE